MAQAVRVIHDCDDALESFGVVEQGRGHASNTCMMRADQHRICLREGAICPRRSRTEPRLE